MYYWILAGLGALLLANRNKKGKDAPDAAGILMPDIAPKGDQLDAQLRSALRHVMADFGIDVARNVERIYRNETANFTSKQFTRTNTPGMHAFRTTWPFGWSFPNDGLNPGDFLPTITMDENSGGSFEWVRFRDLGKAVHFVGYFLNKFGNNAGRWNSTDPARQAEYAARIATYPTPIVDKL